MYSEKGMEYFRNPRNAREIEDADGIGAVGNPICGDMMTFYTKVKDNIISEMTKGKTIEEALKITNQLVAQELGGLPPNKLHCSNLGADALHKAIKDYLNKSSR